MLAKTSSFGEPYTLYIMFIDLVKAIKQELLCLATLFGKQYIMFLLRTQYHDIGNKAKTVVFITVGGDYMCLYMYIV